MNAKTGKNAVIFNLDSRTEAYPCFALAKDGKIAKVESAGALPEGFPSILLLAGKILV